MGPKKAINKTNVIVETTTTANTNTNTDTTNETDTVKIKRGRKSKKELMASLNMTFTKDINGGSEKPPFIHMSVNELQKPPIDDLSLKDDTTSDNISNSETIYDNLINHDSFSNTVSSQNTIQNHVVIINNPNVNVNVNEEQAPTSKKRGRKPKGGKIIQQVLSNEIQEEDRPNIILHLKCSIRDLQSTSSSLVESYNFESGKSEFNDCVTLISNENTCNNKHTNYIGNLDSMNDYDDNDDESVCKDVHKEINKKLKQLEQNLHLNNVHNKKSCCFWDTCEFDNPPIYIPKHFINGTYHVYGCFCSPECGVAYLMNEHIDSSTKFERYHMFNLIYTKIYDYKKNVKPAPNPYYTLEKYYGNLTIQEYRSLLQNERLFLIVDKPLTRILPELHEDNDDFILNNKIIPSNNYHLKANLHRKKTTKTSIVNKTFGIVNQEV